MTGKESHSTARFVLVVLAIITSAFVALPVVAYYYQQWCDYWLKGLV